MKEFKFLLTSLMGTALITMVLYSCAEDPLPPKATINYQIGDDGYTVSFSATVENVDTYAWNFGDGKGTSTEVAPEYTFPKSGNYTVTLTVTGDGGTVDATTTVTIEATFIEFLTGGPGNTAGKTWVISRTATVGTDGISAVDPDFTPVHLPFVNNILDLFGLGSEYDNEFTFHYDGTYSVKGINSAVLYGRVFGTVSQITPVFDPGPSVRMYAGEFTDITSAEWTLHEDTDLIKNSCKENFSTGTTDPPQDITFIGIDYLTFTNGGFFGIRDFNTEVIVREITEDKIIITLFLSSLDPDTYPEWYQKPSLLVTITCEPK